MKTLFGLQRTAGVLAAHDAGDAARGLVVGDHDGLAVQHVGLAVQRQHLLAILGHAGVQIAATACRHRTHAAAGRDPGRSDWWHPPAPKWISCPPPSAGPAPICGEGPFFTLRISRPANNGAGIFVLGREVQRDAFGAGEFARHRLDLSGVQRAQPGRGQIARNAVHAGRIAAIGRDGNIDHRIGKALARRRPGAPTLLSAASSMMPS